MNEYPYDGDPISLEDLQRQSDESRWWEVDSSEDAAPSAKREKLIYSIGDLSDTVDEVEARILKHDLNFFDRGNNLVRPIVSERAATEGRTIVAAMLTPVSPPYLTKQLSKIIDWRKLKKKKTSPGEPDAFDEIPIDPPPQISVTLLANSGDWNFHQIAGIVTAPTLRRDGTILWKEGYDPRTKLLLLSPPDMPNFPEYPTRDDALVSIRRLDALLDGFPFVSPVDRSVAISGLITPVCRAAMTVAPLHAVSAPTAGSGKSFLVDLFSALISGTPAPATPVGKSEEETEKRLSSAMMEGSPIIVLDNVNGQLYGDALCQCVERPIVKFRVLGESRMVEIENKQTIFATGNNISLVDDMTRRTILCSLDAEMERPEMRQFNFDPMSEILDNRGQYIADALTIVRAYKLAGHPDKLPQLASFGEWSDLVRSAIVWLGFDDPLISMDRVRDADGRLDSLKAFIAAWYSSDPTGKKSSADLIELSLTDTELQLAMKAFCNPRGPMDGVQLGKKLHSVKGRVVDGFKIIAEKDSHTKTNIWRLQKVMD